MTVFDKNLAWIDELGTGWHALFRQLVQELALLDPTLKIVQAKQKFGGLRVYLDRYDECAAALIRAAETEACTSCERCGKMAALTLNPTGYFETLCEEHRGNAEPASSPIFARFSIRPRRRD